MSFEHKPHPYTIAQNKNSKMTRPVQVATWSLRKATWSFTAGKVGLVSRTWKELCLWLLRCSLLPPNGKNCTLHQLLRWKWGPWLGYALGTNMKLEIALLQNSLTTLDFFGAWDGDFKRRDLGCFSSLDES